MNTTAAAHATALAGQPVDPATHFEVERFLVREARVLNDNRLRQWLHEMVCEDIHYFLPVREVRYQKDQRPIGSSPGAAIFNDNYQMLDMRIQRVETGIAWPEDPVSHLRRFVTNVDVEWSDVDGEVTAYSNIMVYRNRRQRDQAVVYGGRRDSLRRVQGQWRLAARHITIDQRVVLDKNLCYFM